MAAHAGLCVREAGKCRFLDRCVAVTAINSKQPDVMTMTELHPLIDWNISACPKIRARESIQRNACRSEQHRDPDQYDPCNSIGSLAEELSHTRRHLKCGSIQPRHGEVSNCENAMSFGYCSDILSAVAGSAAC